MLREAGLNCAVEAVNLATKQTASGADFAAINAKGYVPALQLDDGQVLTEGPAIVQYLADQRPESWLAPRPRTMERYRLHQWLTFIGTELHKQFSPLFNPTAPEETKASAREYLGHRIDFLAKTLEAKPYLLGDRFTVADAYLFTVLSWSRHVGVDPDPASSRAHQDALVHHRGELISGKIRPSLAGSA